MTMMVEGRVEVVETMTMAMIIVAAVVVITAVTVLLL